MMTNLMMLWNEFSGMDVPSIRSSFEEATYFGQDDIIRYLENGKVKLPSAGVGVDLITGDVVSVQHAIMTDGEYTWDSMFPYYVKKYNLRLPKEFEEKVFSTLKSA